MEIKIILLNVLTEHSVMKRSVELLQRSKVGVIYSTDSAVNTQYEATIGIQTPLKNSHTQYEANIGIQTPLKNSQLQFRKMDVRELNQFLKIDERQAVKEVMLTEINTIPSNKFV
jgi:hypothetical protein